MKIPKLCKNGDGRAFSIYPGSGGRREYFGEYGTPQAEKRYREWLARLLNSEGLLIQKKNQSEYYVAELVSMYVDFWKPKLTKKQFGVLWKNLDRLLCLIGSELAVNIGPLTLVQYQQYMSKELYTIGKTQKRYNRGTINKAVRQVKEFVKWCCKYEYLPPEHHLKLEAVDNLRKGEYNVEESTPVPPITLGILLKTVPYFSEMIQVMTRVQYYCGMRPGEVCRLNWGEIDRTKDIWIYVPIDHKTKHKKWKLMKAIPPSAQKLILSKEWFQRGDYLFDPRINGRGVSHRFEHFSVNGYASGVERGVSKALKKGVIQERWTPNQIRHAIATDIRTLYGRREDAQDYLGHSSIDSTEVYAERTQERIIELARRLENDLFQNGGVDEGVTREDEKIERSLA